MRAATFLDCRIEGVRGVWGRIPVFWRFQLASWLVFTIFLFPSKRVMLETIPASILVSLYRDGLGFLITIGMREIYRRSYHDKVTKVGLVALVAGVSLASGRVMTLFSLGFREFLDFGAENSFTPLFQTRFFSSEWKNEPNPILINLRESVLTRE